MAISICSLYPDHESAEMIETCEMLTWLMETTRTADTATTFPTFPSLQKVNKNVVASWIDGGRIWPQTSQIWRFSRIFCAALATCRFSLGKDSIRIGVLSCQNVPKSQRKNESLTNYEHHHQHPTASINPLRNCLTPQLDFSIICQAWPSDKAHPGCSHILIRRGQTCPQKKGQLFGVLVFSARIETDMSIDPVATTFPQNVILKTRCSCNFLCNVHILCNMLVIFGHRSQGPPPAQRPQRILAPLSPSSLGNGGAGWLIIGL